MVANALYVEKYETNTTTGQKIAKFVPDAERPSRTDMTGLTTAKDVINAVKRGKTSTTGNRTVNNVRNAGKNATTCTTWITVFAPSVGMARLRTSRTEEVIK